MAAVSLAAGLVIGLTGCVVDTHKEGNGEHVKVTMPFGGVQVKTDDAVVLPEIGLAVYPGAEPVKKKDHGDKDTQAADINVSLGDFKMRIKAASYHSNDSQDKLLAFYRNELGKYGAVIQCSDGQPVGQPVKTPEGLTCDSHSRGKSGVSGKIELKAGSEQHQHVVEIDPQSDGAKFALVALDLPLHISFGEHNSDDQ